MKAFFKGLLMAALALMVLSVILVPLCGWFVWRQSEAPAVSEFVALGGEVVTTYNGPAWLRKWCPEGTYGEVTAAYVKHPAAMELLWQFPQCERVSIDCEVDASDLAVLAELTSVTDLSLAFSEVNDRHIRQIANCEQLKRLELPSDSPIVSFAPLGRLSKLESFACSRSDVRDEALAFLSSITTLRDLYVSDTRCDGRVLEDCPGLTEMKSLNAANTLFDDRAMERLSAARKLEWLDVSDTRVTDSGIAHLGGLTQLKGLSMRGLQISDVSIPTLLRFTNLEDIDLNQTQVTLEGVQQLAVLPELNTIHVEHLSIPTTIERRIQRGRSSFWLYTAPAASGP